MSKVTKINIPMLPEDSSRETVWHMFNRISSRYDLLNRLLSLRQDVRWRLKLADFIPEKDQLAVLDVATGTADQLIALHKRANSRIQRSIGVDMADQMLKIGRDKLKNAGLDTKIVLRDGDATALPFKSDTFDVVTISFGIRNVSDVQTGLNEMYRVLKDGGRALILEFSLPQRHLIRNLYLFYFRRVLPYLGGLISGNNRAYRYLNETVESFPYSKAFIALMNKAGFADVTEKQLSLGIATIYSGDKNG